jgi:hypothetical protein
MRTMYGSGDVDEVTGLELWDPQQFTRLWQRFVERQIERDERMDLIARVVRGDWSVVDADDSQLWSKSPNIIQVGLEDTAAAAAMIPTVRVQASDPSKETAKKQAAKMEQLGASYLDKAGGKLFFQSSSIGAGAYGFCAWNVVNDGPMGTCGSRLEWRDPMSCYPEPDVGTLGAASRMFFAREMYMSQLPEHYRDVFYAHCMEQRWEWEHFDNHGITLIEYSDCERVTVGVSYDAATIPSNGDISRAMYGQAKWVSVIVDDYPNAAGMCRGIYGQIPSLDGYPRGQVIPVLHAHIRLVAAAMEHAHQAVYNELVIVDPIGDVPMGPDAVIELGPNGKAFRLPPASVGFSFFEETQRLLDAVHVGARWPKNRPGDVQQSQASSKFVESTLGVQNAVIATHHTLFERMAQQAIRVAFALDAAEGPERTEAVTLRNQQFQLEFRRKDIDLAAKATVEYGLGFGRDVTQSAVLALQLHGGGMISLEDAQENYPGITDVARTRSRILNEQLGMQLMAKLMQMIESGEVDGQQHVDMMRDVAKGDLLVDVFEKYVLKPQQAMKDQMLTSGLPGGGQLMPGPPPTSPAGGPGGPTPPTAPDPRDVLAGVLGGGGGGGAPAGVPQPMSRLSVPMGGGSFAGSQMG